jgi:hypothetical protein
MNQLTTRQVQEHVTILGWLYIVGNSFFLVIGGFVFMLLSGVGAVSRDPEALVVLSVVGSTVALLMMALAVPGLLAGYGLLRRKAWARVLAIVVGFLGLMNFPVGTAIGLYTFWVLMQDTAFDLFFAPTPA